MTDTNIKRLSGKVAIVTGSTSGIGLGIAISLAENGCNLVLNGSRPSNEQITSLISIFETNHSIRAVYVQADFSKPDVAAATLIGETVKAFGTVDILVNNAGIQHVSKIEDFPVEKWDQIIAINLSSAFHTMRLAIPHMKRNPTKWGRIVNISSVHSKVASINKGAYVASKHGLNGLTKVVALENADGNITCNALCPGWVDTPLVQNQIATRAASKNLSLEEATADLLSEKQPSKKFTTPKQIGEMVVFLCGEGGANITGSEIVMDGGWTVQ
eukprot:TRINITY_DN9444_c1_g1_i1.p1 TRINITY_DN9444_c1_g1~~TRINITY_DN9444_c1_g1_i1.p1  ORF type:complete len:284 (+),score=51.56 TRINITY_DN9444_c1_g1_i1:39-854(+)